MENNKSFVVPGVGPHTIQPVDIRCTDKKLWFSKIRGKTKVLLVFLRRITLDGVSQSHCNCCYLGALIGDLQATLGLAL